MRPLLAMSRWGRRIWSHAQRLRSGFLRKECKMSGTQILPSLFRTCGHDAVLRKALSIFWTSGRKSGVIDVSQQIDRMCTTRVECPCITPKGQHFLMEHGRPMLGTALVAHICKFFCASFFCLIAWRRSWKVHYPGVPRGENVVAAHGRPGNHFFIFF